MTDHLLPGGARQLSLFEVKSDIDASPRAGTVVDTARRQTNAVESETPSSSVAGGDTASSVSGALHSTSEVRQAKAVTPQSTNLRAAIDEFKQFMAASNRSKHTRESFALDLKLLLEHTGDAQLTSISERDLRSFISWISVQRHNSPTSVRRKVATLKNFFAYLRRELVIPSDPAMRLIYPEIYPALPEFLEDAQAARLLDVAEEHASWKSLIALMIDTGLKRDEIVALGRADIHLAGDVASYLVVRETEQAKRLRSRRLEISDDVAEILRDFQLEDPEAQARERFFDLSPRGVNFVVEVCGARAGLVMRGTKLTPQILRETFAVRKMRAFVRSEEQMRASGFAESEVMMAIEVHDIALLTMLGLQPEPESAKKYRKLVRSGHE